MRSDNSLHATSTPWALRDYAVNRRSEPRGSAVAHRALGVWSSHEGSGRHPRQHGGDAVAASATFTANSHRVCSLLRLSFYELIANVMGHIDAEARAAVIRYLAAIPA